MIDLVALNKEVDKLIETQNAEKNKIKIEAFKNQREMLKKFLAEMDGYLKVTREINKTFNNKKIEITPRRVTIWFPELINDRGAYFEYQNGDAYFCKHDPYAYYDHEYPAYEDIELLDRFTKIMKDFFLHKDELEKEFEDWAIQKIKEKAAKANKEFISAVQSLNDSRDSSSTDFVFVNFVKTE